MSTMPCAIAPGKLLLAGEYAVLDGYQAVAIAVDRYAYARPGIPAESSAFLDALAEVMRERGLSPAPPVDAVTVDTARLRDANGVKLGLGSSAAATVAAARLCLPQADSATLHEVAHTAHRRAQALRGMAGSGADIAAATYGGTLTIQPAAVPATTPRVAQYDQPPGLHWRAVWLGHPADTVDLVKDVHAWREGAPQHYDNAIATIAAGSQAFSRALEDGSVDGIIAATRQGHDAIVELSRASLCPVVVDTHHQLAKKCTKLGGAAKSTGAGGGDIAWTCFPDMDSAHAFDTWSKLNRIHTIRLSVARGAQLYDAAASPT